MTYSRLCRQKNKNIEDALQSAENAKKEMENLTADNEKILAGKISKRFDF